MTDLAPAGLDREKGYVTAPGWSYFGMGMDPEQLPPELQWPRSIVTYGRMARDAQVKQVLNALTLMIRKPRVLDKRTGERVPGRWCVIPNGARDEVVQHTAEDLALPIQGQERGVIGRTRGRFQWGEHVRLATWTSFVQGFAAFEQSARLEEPVTTSSRWRLRKLALRPAETIANVRTARDGGLEGIDQFPPGTTMQGALAVTGGSTLGLTAGYQVVPINVDRLVWYAHEMEPGKWTGKSLLLPVWPNFLVKDRLIRVDAVKHERNGLGVPVTVAPQGATPADLLVLEQIATKFRAGQESGASLPFGADLKLKGVEGTLPDTLASIRYHDEQIAGLMLTQFLKFGTTDAGGNRALGETTVSFFDLAVDTLVEWLADLSSEHVVEDLVDWTYGADEAAPRIGVEPDPELGWGDVEEEPDAAAQARKLTAAEAVQKVYLGVGTVVSADEARQIVNDAAGTNLPMGFQPTTEETAPAGDFAVAARGRRTPVVAADASSLNLPDRELRRQPYVHEVQAAADFAGMEQTFLDRREEAVALWREVRAGQIEELVTEVGTLVDQGQLAQLASLSPAAAGGPELLEVLRATAEESITQAVAEATAQGATIPNVGVEDLDELLALRAAQVEQIMASGLGDSASRAAVRLATPGLAGADVAAQVRDHLEALTDAFLEEQLGGAVSAAQLQARRMVIGKGPATRIYASELLDTSTCSRCVAIDGTEYASAADADRDYPTGGYAECEGGPRCRGTLVAVYGEDS